MISTTKLGGLLAGKPERKSGAKTLYLHIGHYKTGTSALQVFLEENPKLLARHGLEYTSFERFHSKHSNLAFSLYRSVGIKTLLHGYAKPIPAQKMWGDLFAAVRASSQPRILASSEEFMRLGAHPKASEMLAQIVRTQAEDIDIRIIAYLRQPQAHLRSWYNQLIKMGAQVSDFDETVRGIMERVHFDYAAALEPWVEIFGSEKVSVRPYDESSRETTALYADFLSVLGVDLPEKGVTYPASDPNRRLPEKHLPLHRMIANAQLPESVRNWTQERAQQYLQAQHAAVKRKPLLNPKAITLRSRAGLDYVSGLPGSTVKADAFQAAITKPEDKTLREAREANSFLLAEVQVLRQRLFDMQASMGKRISALEKMHSEQKKDAK